MDHTQIDSFITRYMAMWHEPDAQRRHAIVRSLWAEDAENITRRFSAHGMAEIIARVDRAHHEWVADRHFIFRPRSGAGAAGAVDAHNQLVKFSWEMLPRDGGAIEARGLDVFQLRQDGRIGALYQFAEPIDA